MKQKNEVAVLGGGCFWCTEAVFNQLKGVISVIPGYSGGTLAHPTYEEVCEGSTGHAEVIKIEFDPSIISYRQLLTIFFDIHDPTTLNRQGNDVGPQYRSIIFYLDKNQEKIADKVIQELTTKKTFNRTIVTQVEPLQAFYPAESYHQDYYNKNSYMPYCDIVIAPKIKHFKEQYATLLK